MSYVPPKKNSATGYVTYVSLVSQANPLIFQANPTLAAGDVKIAIDDGAPANLGTLPVVDADFTKRVKVTLSQAETNGDNLTIVFSDAAGAEWCDLTINIQTSSQTLDEVDTVVDAIKTKTDLIPADIVTQLDTNIPAIKTSTDAILADTGTDGVIVATNNDKTGYGLSDDAITSAKFDESTAFPLKSADTGSTQIARTGADSDTLETLSDQLDNIHAKTTNLPSDPADESLLETAISAVETKVDTIDSNVDAIKAQTDNLPSDPADESLLEDAISTAESNIRGTDDDTLETLSDQLDNCATLGVGATAVTYTQYQADGVTPLADVDIWATSDLAGTNVIASGITTDEGKWTFRTDIGSGENVYIWRKKAGWNFTNPDTEVVP